LGPKANAFYALNDATKNRLYRLSEELGLQNSLCNLQETIPKFLSYNIPEFEDGYGRDDIAIWIQFLNLTKKKNALTKQILGESNKVKNFLQKPTSEERR
jgi:hypothetical protein